MDNDERELFARSVRAALADDALESIGWAEAVADDARSAIAVLFEEQGRACAATSALDVVVGATSRVRGGIDPAARVVDATLDPAALRLARLALSHELIGASRAMLDLARTHALERIQFGVPVASFQAVRHRLAETLVAIETAQGALDAAWIDDAAHHAAIAKALAGRGARVTAKHCQQVLAGIGFTAEHPFHRYFRRVLVLDAQFGSAQSLTHELGEAIVAAGALPTPVAL
jgi:alkylation response protein AidB-like acyl-CoA dehydrogenase